MDLSKQEQAKLVKVYDTWLHSYLNGDVKTYDFYLDDAYRFVGSTSNEEFLSRKDTTKFFEATANQLAGKTDLRNTVRTIELIEGVAFITELFDAYFLIESNWTYYGRFRFTSALRKKKEGWRFIYQHFSMPDSKAQEGETLGAEKITQENLELRDAIKRRTVELEQKNRELEIEASLERIRARAMAMKNSSELADLVDTLIKELTKLDFSLTMCIINIIDEADRSNTVWATNPETGKNPEPYYLKFEDYPFHHAMWKGWKKRKRKWVYTIEGAEKEIYDEYLFNKTEFRRFSKKNKTAFRSLERYVASFTFSNFGGLQTVGEVPLSEESLDILARFGKVFDLTYTRFNDLKQAEAQTREAQIEASLERVRARSLAMHKSEELKEVIQVVYEQFVQLNMPIEHTGFIIDYKANDDMHIWLADEHGVPSQVIIPYFDSAHWNSFKEAKDKGLDFFANKLTFKEKNSFYQKLLKLIPGLPEEAKKFYLTCPGLAISTVLLENVGLYIENFSGISYSDEENNTLMRFGKVFQQTYTRFLDLQKAEEQAKEAQIEASLERVRSKTMAMHNSKEVGETVVTLFNEVLMLGLDKSIRCGIGILEGNEGMETWSANFFPNGEIDLRMGMLDMTIHPLLMELKKAWKKGEAGYKYKLIGNDVTRYYKALNNEPEYPFNADLNTLPEKVFHNSFFFSEGILFAFTSNPLSEEAIKVLKRFTSVFEQTYTRFLDLQKAEEQAKEAQVGVALERVRSRTLAMHKSDELSETAVVLFRQLIDLGIEPNRLFITIIKEDGLMEFWITDEDGSKISNKYTGSSRDNRIFKRMIKGWQEKKKSLQIDLKGKELQDYFKYLSSRNVPFIQGPSQKRRVQTMSYFSQGFIGIASPEPLTDETTVLLERFADVFNLTYTRFNDLQLTENQIYKANIEIALEKVRARALAMQEPEELKDVAGVLRHEMGALGIEELETCSIYINDKEIEKAECWYALKDVRNRNKHLVSDHFELSLNDTWVGGEMLKFYNTDNDKTSIVMTGENRKEWIRYCEEKSVPFRGYYGGVIPDRTYHLYKFSHGSIGVATAGDISKENWGLLKRAATVFSLAYSRFKDLTQAKTDLQQLKEEKHRAENALTELKATQNQLIQSEKMASLGELTAGIAHEIQNPLNFVNNFSELSEEMIEELAEEIKDNSDEIVVEIMTDLKQNLNKITNHGKRASSIVKGMLEHSRTSSGKKELTDVNLLADEYMRLSYHGLRAKDKTFNAEFKSDLDQSIPKIEIIPQDIGRVILNLINNAFHAVNQKSKKLEDNYQPTVNLITKKKANAVEIIVKDNGGGISKENREKIFQPFFTTKPTGEGTGLGLSLAYDIITKSHGGKLIVDSKKGAFTQFTIVLPIKNW